MDRFSGKTAIVTGGGSGIGRAICAHLAAIGAAVAVADRNARGAQETVEMIRKNGGSAEPFTVDVSKYEEIEKLVNAVSTAHGRIDYLFNNAGISIDGEFQDLTLEHWKRVLDVNLWGVIHGCHAVYPIMKKQGSGQIINTASLGGLIPGGLMTAYSTGKHAVVGLSLNLRSEAKQYGIKVNVLCPGVVRTPILENAQKVSGFMDAERNRQIMAKVKMPAPEDIMKRVFKGIMKNKAIIVAPASAKIYWYIHRMFPSLIPAMQTALIKSLKK